jgi:hypothetical protein
VNFPVLPYVRPSKAKLFHEDPEKVIELLIEFDEHWL